MLDGLLALAALRSCAKSGWLATDSSTSRQSGRSAEEDRARMQQAEAALRLAGVDAASVRKIAGGGVLQDGLTVHAKTAGAVTALDAKAGQRVAQDNPLMRLADTRQL